MAVEDILKHINTNFKMLCGTIFYNSDKLSTENIFCVRGIDIPSDYIIIKNKVGKWIYTFLTFL